MPAYFDTGFSVRQPMWHGEGLVLDEYPTDWADARQKAGLMWEPQPQPVYGLAPAVAVCDLCGVGLNDLHRDTCAAVSDDHLRVGPEDVSAQNLTNSIVELVDHKQIVRSDTGATLGVVGQGFELVMHEEMGDILEAVVGAGAKFETAGSCKNGAQVWALAYLDEPLTVANDDTETYPFVALLNSHDGSGACKLTSTSIRVVCWNTYNAASMQGERSGRQFVFRHTAGVHDRLEEAKQALSGVRDEAIEWNALATELFGMKVDDATMNHFLADFIPEPPADVVSARVRNNIDRARTVFKSLYLDSPTTESHRGTALGIVDASVEYLDHVRGYRNADTYLGRTLLRPEPLKAKAVSLVRSLCTA